MAQPPSKHIDRLIASLSMPDPCERQFAANRLATLDCREESVRIALETAAQNDPDASVRMEARLALEQLGFPTGELTGSAPLDAGEAGAQDALLTGPLRDAGFRPEYQGELAADEDIAAGPAFLPVSVPDVETAAFWERGLAFFIDMIILIFVSGFISCLGSVSTALPGMQVILAFANLALPLVYFSLAYSTHGQTAGKKAMHIKVISMDGMPLNRTQGIIRSIGYLVSSIPFNLGFLWSIWDSEKQTWHDKIAGTCVVRQSVDSNQLTGLKDPLKERQRQKRWLIGLSISALLFLVGAAGFWGYFEWRGVPEVQEMGPWPGADHSPEDLLDLDLSGLGLEPYPTMDAKDEPWIKDLPFQKGVFRSYKKVGASPASKEEIPLVFTWSLRFQDRQSASSSYAGLQEWSGANCSNSLYFYTRKSGIIHCGYQDYYSKVFWNDRWIVVIDASVGTGYPPAAMVDKVRDAMAAHWHE